MKGSPRQRTEVFIRERDLIENVKKRLNIESDPGKWTIIDRWIPSVRNSGDTFCDLMTNHLLLNNVVRQVYGCHCPIFIVRFWGWLEGVKVPLIYILLVAGIVASVIQR